MPRRKDPNARIWQRRDPVCTVDGCEKPHDSRGFCATHRVRFMKYGDPLQVRPHARWTGEAASYTAIHHRLTRTRGRPSQKPCADCGEPAKEWSYVGGCDQEKTSQRGFPYSLNLDRYVPRCVPCHRSHDRTKDHRLVKTESEPGLGPERLGDTASSRSGSRLSEKLPDASEGRRIMAEGLIAAQANSILTTLVGTNNWLKLHVGPPGAAGTANPATNTTRQQSTFGTPSGGSVSNTALVTWTNVAGSEDYTHVSGWSASTSGTVAWTGTITANPVTTGDKFEIAIGGVTLSLAVAS